MLTRRGVWTPTKADILVLEAVDDIGSTTVNAALYGFSFALYCLCARSLYRQLKDPYHRKQNIGTLAIMSTVVACGFIVLALNVQQNKIQYIDHGDYPWSKGGPYFYDAASGMGTSPMSGAGYAFTLVLDCLMLGVPVWRLWIIWSMSQYAIFVVIFPILLFLAYAGSSIFNVYCIYHRDRFSQQTIYAQVTSNLSLQFAVSLITTLFIIGRIIYIRRRHMKVMGKSDNAEQYMSIITMLVESFALDAAWTFAEIVCSVMITKQTTATLATAAFLTGSETFIRIVAYLLVVYRVSTGRGWSRQTERRLTSLHFNRDGPGTTETTSQASLPMSHV